MNPYSSIEYLNIDDSALLAKTMRNRFLSYIGVVPYLWISATPSDAHRGYIDTNDDDIQGAINLHPGSRVSGWSMDFSGFNIEDFVLGVRIGKVDYRYLELHDTGHIELWVPLDESFCWRQNEQEYETQPRMYPYPVVEYPVSFLRLLRALTELRSECEGYRVQMIYANIERYRLPAGKPDSLGLFQGEMHKAPSGRHSDTLEIDPEFSADAVAYILVRQFYKWFGYPAKAVPFYDAKTKKFQFS